MRRASLMPILPGLTLSALAPRSRYCAASLSEAQLEVDEHGNGALADQLGELPVGLQRAGVLGDPGAFGGDDANVVRCLGARVSAVGIDVEVDCVADRGSDLAQRGDVRLDALAALDLEGAEAVRLHDLGRLARHRLGRLPRHAPAHLDARLPAEQLPQRRAGCCRAQRPARIVDQHLGEEALGEARELTADRRRVAGVDLLHRRQQQVLEHRGERPGRDARPRRPQRRLGHADDAVIANDPEEGEHGAVLDGIEPLDRPRVGQPAEVQRPFRDTHEPSPPGNDESDGGGAQFRAPRSQHTR